MDRHGNEIETRRKRLRFRSWHRGMREMDLLIGPFADRNLAHFTTRQLDEFEELLAQSDNDIYDWIVGRVPIPPSFDNETVRLLKTFVLGSGKD